MQTQKLIEDKPAFYLILPIWFSFFWRTALWGTLGFIGVLVSTFALAGLLKALGLPMSFIRPFFFALTFLGVMIVFVWAPSRALMKMAGKTFCDHQLLVLSSAGGRDTIEDNPPMGFCLKIYLSMLWRMCLWMIIAAIPAAIFVYAVTRILWEIGLNPQAMVIIVTILNMLSVAFCSIWVFGRVFTKILGLDYSGTRLLLMTPQG